MACQISSQVKARMGAKILVMVSKHESVTVTPAQGAKCERCWKILPSVGRDGEHPTLCARCARVVRKLDIQ